MRGGVDRKYHINNIPPKADDELPKAGLELPNAGDEAAPNTVVEDIGDDD